MPLSKEMDDLLFSKEVCRSKWKASKKIETSVSTKLCWGCQKEQTDKDKPFKCCSKCVDLGMVPARFCSQDCFKKSWPRHKAWHKEYKEHMDEVKEYTETNGIRREHHTAGEDESTKAKYDKIMEEASAIFERFDFNGAKDAYRRALKEDPRRPEAYLNIALCYRSCKQFDDSVRYLEQGMERWTLAALTDYLGDAVIHGNGNEWALSSWAEVVYLLLQDYMSVDFKDRKKPDWFCQDDNLKRVTRLAMEVFQKKEGMLEKKLRQMTLFFAFSMSGMFSGGVLQVPYPNPKSVGNRTGKELLEASYYFQNASRMKKNAWDHEDYLSRGQLLYGLAAQKTLDERRLGIKEVDEEKNIVAGNWAYIVGLKSAAGKSLCGKLALCKRVDKKSGRREVQIDGIEETKMIKFENLSKVQMEKERSSDTLVPCLEPESQWIYMRDYVRVMGKMKTKT